ncbi:methylmalonyl-CoA mutase subunit beta [Ulvibacterium sp.]|uniref:methylmalonyl-CoA mutase subunit beta n=1 Tax=Ulvibacterium sp. TaxID=2665914 RepID=UPI003BAA31CA
MSNVNLFDEFDPVSSKAWKQKIQVDLKGADYNETLIWKSPEGIDVKPFYHSEDVEGVVPNVSEPPKKWYVTQSIYANDSERANKKAMEALERGAESLVVTIPSETVSIKNLLADIDLESVPIYLEFAFLSAKYLKSLIDFIGNKRAKVFLNLDIVGNLARTGNWYHSMDKDYQILREIHDYVRGNPYIHILGTDISLYQNAGANKVQQLAYALAQANEYLNFFKELDEEVTSLVFKVSIGTNYFFEIAKLRALRLLWETLAQEYGIEAGCHILALPTKRNKTLYDYNVNMLRTTTESMSAILGGANAVCNLSYDNIFHKDNEFGERMARNQLLILKGESYFEKVANPADGSYYIESLTHQLAERALELFKSIEAGGGFLKQLKEHVIQKKIKESAEKEQSLFDEGKEVLLGTNKYQNDQDHMKEAMEIYPFLKTDKRKTLIEPVLEKRLAESLEQKRLSDE